MATAARPATFNFGARPHRTTAAAWHYFKALVRGELAGREPTPDELHAIGLAGHAYVRCCVGLARNVKRAGSVQRYFASITDTNAKNIAAPEIQFPGDAHGRQREHRSAPTRATVGRDDGDDGGPAPHDHVTFDRKDMSAHLITAERLGYCPECGAPVKPLGIWLSLTHLRGCSLGESARAA